MSPTNKKKQGKTKAATSSTEHASNNPACNTPVDTTASIDDAVSSASTTRVAFREFVELADLKTIKLFLDTVTSSPAGENLRPLWDRAFKEGLRVGHQLYVETVGKLNEAHNKGYEEGYSAGYDEGRRDEEIDWRCDGHSGLCSPLQVRQESSIQTDPPSLVTTGTSTVDEDAIYNPPPTQTNQPVPVPVVMVSSGTPASNDVDNNSQSPPPLISPLPASPELPAKALLLQPLPARLDWADDAASLPILPMQPPPRDLSVLRSSSPKPFASLQRRNKQHRTHFSRPFRENQPFPIPRNTSSRHRFSQPRISPTQFRSDSANQEHNCHPTSPLSLNWEDDPHLSDLSRALKALGWVRPEPAARTPPYGKRGKAGAAAPGD